MSADYKQVKEALASGADPAMLCATCPWDRFCVQPPTMTSSEVEKALNEAKEEDETEAQEAKESGSSGGMPMKTLITAVTIGDKDRMAQVCPVFALRLRSADGEHIVKGLREQMRSWDDDA